MGLMRQMPVRMANPQFSTAVMPNQPVPMTKPTGSMVPTTAMGPQGQLQGQPNIQPAVMPQQPQYGLSGATSALQGGLQGGINQLQRGTQAGMGTLLQGYQAGQQQLGEGIQVLGGSPQAQATVGGAAGVNQQAGQQQFQQGIQGLSQFQPAGVQAQQQQAAMSGALGPDAQRQAFADFSASPEQQFQREQGMEGLINAASLQGGIGGGNILKEAMRFNQGLAAQDIQNRFGRLGDVAGQGLQAAGQAGQLYGQAGGQQAQLAGLGAQLGTQANLAGAASQTQASLANAAQQAQMQRAQASLYGQGAGMAQALAGQGAGMQFGAGQLGAGMMGQTGQALAGMRGQAGRDIAGQMGATATGLSNLQNQQGLMGAELIRQSGGDINAAIQAAANSGNQQALAAILANISTGQGTQLGQSALTAGQAQAAGQQQLGQIAQQRGANQQQLIGNLLGAASYGGLFTPTTP